MSARSGRRATAGLVALATALTLTACSDTSEDSGPGYQPATLGEADAVGVKQVTFTADAARRVALQTAPVRARGRVVAVPYAALIYDQQGGSWVYTAPQPLVYRRAKVVVARVADEEAWLSVGPAPATQVVTMGAAEVYGAELDMGSKH